MTNFRIPGQRALVAVVSAVLLAGCLDASDDAPDTQIINTAPVANAGPDQADVPTSTLVTLEAAGAPTQTLTSCCTLGVRDHCRGIHGDPRQCHHAAAHPDPPQPTFTPDIAGTYTIRLTVDDTFAPAPVRTRSTSLRSCRPPIRPSPTPVRPGLSFAPPALTVNLDGSAAPTRTNDPLTYAWVITSFVPSGVPPATNVSLVGAATATPSFDVTDIDQLGEYTVRLTVSDGTLQSTDDVVITVDKSAPTASVLFGSGALASAALAWTSRKRGGIAPHWSRVRIMVKRNRSSASCWHSSSASPPRPWLRQRAGRKIEEVNRHLPEQEESLQDIPLSVEAFDAATIEKQGLSSTADIVS